MPPQLLIKEIKIVDVEKFVEHLARHFEELGIDSIIHSPITKLEEKEIPRYIDHAKKGISTSLNELNWNRIWGLFEGDKVVGHLNLEGAKLDSMSHRVRLSMGLEINYRSQGFGRKILQCSLEWLSHQKSIEWLDLNVLSHNKRAIQFYENFGFKRISRVIDKFKINAFIYNK